MGRPPHRRQPQPSLADCFNHADLLIADVSSVVSDFTASQKPYVVANPAALPEEEFRRRYPSASAAYPLRPDGAELEKILWLVREGGDPVATRRRELMRHLLGPEESGPRQRFCAAVSRLVADGRPATGTTSLDADGAAAGLRR